MYNDHARVATFLHRFTYYFNTTPLKLDAQQRLTRFRKLSPTIKQFVGIFSVLYCRLTFCKVCLNVRSAKRLELQNHWRPLDEWFSRSYGYLLGCWGEWRRLLASSIGKPIYDLASLRRKRVGTWTVKFYTIFFGTVTQSNRTMLWLRRKCNA